MSSLSQNIHCIYQHTTFKHPLKIRQQQGFNLIKLFSTERDIFHNSANTHVIKPMERRFLGERTY
jgi:hypothetical protein